MKNVYELMIFEFFRFIQLSGKLLKAEYLIGPMLLVFTVYHCRYLYEKRL